MTKTEFLDHLETKLKVLNQKERDDILSEYAQHIEFKMESGLSEEEAIHDFGNLEELAAEILDAYNVNPDYDKKTIHIDGRNFGKKMARAGHKMGGGFRRCSQLVKNMYHNKSKERWNWLLKGLRNLFTLPGFTKKPHIVRKQDGSRLIRLVWNVIKAGMCLLIKGITICVLTPLLLFQLFLVVVLGILIVLVILGYPLIGAAVISLGGLLSGFAFIWFVVSILCSKKAGNEE